MPWNPDLYNKFKMVRFKPFYDLMNLLDGDPPSKAIDLGCGTGEQTKILTDRFLQANFLGIDTSKSMLAKSKEFESSRLQFEHRSIEQFAQVDDKWDLIFSNAALQWVDNHSALFPKLISKLNPGGQFAVQMPSQKENILNQLLLRVVIKEPLFTPCLTAIKPSPVLTLDDYAKMMFQGGLENLAISIRVYPIIAKDELTLYDFIAGTTLIPYMEKLDEQGKVMLKIMLLQEIKSSFSQFPAIYAFKRLLLYGVKS